jgi:hypothetical protein
MGINIVSGITGRMADMVEKAKVWADYDALWAKKDARQESANETPAAPLQDPKLALSNPRRGSHWFMALKSLSGRATRATIPNTARVAPEDLSATPGFGTARREEDNHVPPIPTTAPGHSPIRTAKAKPGLLDPFPPRPANVTKNTRGSEPDKRVRDFSAEAKQAINQRVAVLKIMNRELKRASLLR